MLNKPTLLLLSWVIFFVVIASIHGYRESLMERKKRILDSILSAENDPRIRPNGTDSDDGPVKVTVDFYIRWLDSIDVTDMAYSTQVTFRQRWKDSRLIFDDADGRIPFINIRDSKQIWRPDVFFANEKNGHFHDMLTRNALTRVYADGNVLYSIRLSLLMSCLMDLRNFPMDTQTCAFIIASYGYTTRDIEFVWKEDSPVEMSDVIAVPQYSLGNISAGYCTSRTKTGIYSCLKLEFVLKRDFHIYLSQLYIPSCVLVAVSWLSFWLHVSTPSVRVTLPLVGLFLLGCLSLRSRAALNISYTTSLDVWIDTCAVFLLLTLVEYFLARWLASRKGGKVGFGKGSLENGTGEETKTQMGKLQSKVQNSWQWMKNQSHSRRIDILSRVIFPIAFLFFNLYYWLTYPIATDYF